MENLILVLGSGHLASQITNELAGKGYTIEHIKSEEFKEKGDTTIQESSLAYAQNRLNKAGGLKAQAIFVADREDKNNIHLLLAALSIREDIPVLATFLNERIALQLQKIHKNLYVFNLADATAPFIIQALKADPKLKSDKREKRQRPKIAVPKIPTDNLIYRLALGFIGILIGGTIFFEISEGASLERAFYLMVTVVTSVNFNDVTLTNQTIIVKTIRTFILLGAWTYAVATMALLIDQFMKWRIDTIVHGRRHYRLRNHVILCGLGRIGYRITRELLRRGFEVIIIEENPHNHYLDTVRSCGAKVLIGNAALSSNLANASIENARAVLSLINDDSKNLEIGLAAKSLGSTRLILRIFDKGIAEEVRKQLKIQYTFSTSVLGADKLISTMASLLK